MLHPKRKEDLEADTPSARKKMQQHVAEDEENEMAGPMLIAKLEEVGINNADVKKL